MRKRNSKYIYSKTILNNIFMISGKRSGEGTPLPTNFDNLQDSITYTYGTDCTLEYSSTPNNGASSGILKVAQCSETFPLDNFIDHFYSSAVDLKELSKSMFWKLMLAQFLLTLMYKKGFGPKTIHMNQRPKIWWRTSRKAKVVVVDGHLRHQNQQWRHFSFVHIECIKLFFFLGLRPLCWYFQGVWNVWPVAQNGLNYKCPAHSG